MSQKRNLLLGFLATAAFGVVVVAQHSIATQSPPLQRSAFSRGPLFQADGNWVTDDGRLTGKWKMRGRVNLAATGGFEGNLVLADFPGVPGPLKVEGGFDRRSVSFEIVADAQAEIDGRTLSLREEGLSIRRQSSPSSWRMSR